MIKIQLSRGKHTIVDEEDYEALSQFRWCASPGTRSDTWYACRNGKLPGGIRTTIYMHRQLLSAPDGAEVDHIDRDGLNNTRSNLRLCSRGENCANMIHKRKSSTGFIGVYFDSDCIKPYAARAFIDGAFKRFGRFSSAEEAARERDKHVFAKYRDFAVLNFPHEDGGQGS